MSPKKSNGSWRGPCPHRNFNKSIWSLLGKGIGNRHFRLLTRKVESGNLSYCLFHYAVNMLSMLLKCQFINSGLISIRQSKREQMLYILVLCLLLQSVNAKPTSLVHYNEGHQCYITTCAAGEEAVPCPEDWTHDRCRPCPADKYMEQDNVPSDMKLRCYTVRDTCMPDIQRLMQTGAVSASNPPRCVCDTTRDYYQHRNNPDDCRKMKCLSTETLLLNGTCMCREGRVLNSEGECVWKIITDLTTPVPLSNISSTANDAHNTTTISTITDLTDTTTTKITQNASERTTTGNPLIKPTHGSDIMTPIIVTITLFLIITGFIGFIVKKCVKRKKSSATITASSDENKKDPGSPLITVNGDVHGDVNVQFGSRNIMHQKNENAYNNLPVAGDSDDTEEE